MSTLGMLCNLEVLKLGQSAFVGPRWETTDGGFQRLKFLRLQYTDIVQWEASDTDFPSLQQLELRSCHKLEGIPLEIGNIPTLQRIEVDWCNQSTENSAKNIQEEQQNLGNDLLKIHIRYVSELRFVSISIWFGANIVLNFLMGVTEENWERFIKFTIAGP